MTRTQNQRPNLNLALCICSFLIRVDLVLSVALLSWNLNLRSGIVAGRTAAMSWVGSFT